MIKNSKTDRVNTRPSFDEWGEDLIALPKEQHKAFVYKTLKNKKHLHIFGRYFFPNIIKGKNDVPQCHIDLTDELSLKKDSGIVFPRGFAKTTWEKIDTLHDINYGLEPVILYISNTLRDAQFHFESIKAELENNELLISVYGDLVPPDVRGTGRKWTNTHFETLNKINVVARGAGKGRGVNIKNQRPTKIIIDDAEDDDIIRSVDQRQKFHRWLYDVILPSIDSKRGFVKMIGTVLAKDSELIKFYNRHGGIFRRGEEDGKSIWPDFFPYEKLMEMKAKMGSRTYSKEILNNPVDIETAIIKPEWIDPYMYDHALVPTILKKVIMLDPQSGESKSADYYGLTVVGFYRKDAHRYVISSQRGRDTQINQAALLVRTYQKHPETVTVGVEKVMAQVAVYQLLLDWKAGRIDLPDVNNKDRNMPIMAVEPGGKDKVARLQMHEAAFERGEIHLHQTMNELKDNLVCFPNIEHDDDVDSLIYCLEWSYKSNLQIGDLNDNNEDTTIMGNTHKKIF